MRLSVTGFHHHNKSDLVVILIENKRGYMLIATPLFTHNLQSKYGNHVINWEWFHVKKTKEASSPLLITT